MKTIPTLENKYGHSKDVLNTEDERYFWVDKDTLSYFLIIFENI
jgi:hypothetical protein